MAGMNDEHTLLIEASRRLCRRMEELDLKADGIRSVYNPLSYAAASFEAYLRRYGMGKKRTLFLGMNPGPWGMAQTGVPFGEVAAVRDWLGICEEVGHPPDEHPKRPVSGFSCTRSEVSGRRLWGLMAERFAGAEEFFADHFVVNYCPLIFLEDSGKNRTPDKLPKAERDALQTVCDDHLREVIGITGAGSLIGIGKYAEKAFLRITGDANPGENRFLIASILHPSPASPAANRGWAEQAAGQLESLGVW
jgi:single-strand selective monofunctional uracil DNA glycosylase